MSEQLNDAQQRALLALYRRTAPCGERLGGWGGTYGAEGVALMALSLAPEVHPHVYGQQTDHVRSTGNTLKALKRRGLAENDGGGVFLQARWRITFKGVETAKELLKETT